VSQLSSMLKVQSSAELPQRLSQTLEKLKAAEKEVDRLRQEKLQAEAGQLVETAQTVGQVRVLTHDAGQLPGDQVRALAADLRHRLGEQAAVAAVAGTAAGRPVIVVAANQAACEVGVKAGALARAA